MKARAVALRAGDTPGMFVCSASSGEAARWLLAALFFLSGLAALTYQITWQRLMVPFAGGDVAAISLVVAVFMLGLGAGGVAGGMLADRAGRRQNLALFAILEGLVALSAVGAQSIIVNGLMPRSAMAAESPLTASAMPALVLLVPASLMGMSLPIVVRGLMRDLNDAAPILGRLYGLNTLGAACGAIATTWMLIPLSGVEGALRAAALLNGLAAIAALPVVFARETCGSSGEANCPSGQPCAAASRHGDFTRCLAAFLLAGFLAISLEMVWFRLLGVMLKSTALTMGTLLAIYLGALGVGSLAGVRLAAGRIAPGRDFLWCQCAAGLYAVVAAAGALFVIDRWDALGVFKEYLASYEPVDANSAVQAVINWIAGKAGETQPWMGGVFFALHFALPAVTVGPSAFLMGASFPLMQRAVQTELQHVGRRVGWLQAANIAGCVLGSLATSFMLFPAIGTHGALRLIGGLAIGFGLAAAMPSLAGKITSRFLRGPAMLLAGACVVAFVVPDRESLWTRAHGARPGAITVAEDGAGVSVLKKCEPSVAQGRTEVFVNGIGQSWLPYEGIHSLLGMLPVLIHPEPRDVALIGLGSGDTLYCASARRETKRIVCVEMLGAQIETLRDHAARSGYPALRTILADGRISLIRGDGRRFLMNSAEKFDIIEADALRPTGAHSGFLYSEEYFRLVKSRLKPGGFAVTWKPTPRTGETFLHVFPHVLDLGPILIGSSEPVPLDRSAVELRLADFEIRHHYRAAGLNVNALILPLLRNGLGQFMREGGPDHQPSGAINTDLHPRDEFDLPALWGR